MLDWDRIAELRTEVGPQDFLEIADLFLAECAEGLATFPDGDPGPALHQLRGAAGNLGFSALARLAAAMEAAPHTTDPGALGSAFDEARSALRAGLAARGWDV